MPVSVTQATPLRDRVGRFFCVFSSPFAFARFPLPIIYGARSDVFIFNCVAKTDVDSLMHCEGYLRILEAVKKLQLINLGDGEKIFQNIIKLKKNRTL